MRLSRQISSVAALGDPIRASLYEFVVVARESVSRDAAAQGVGIPRHVAKFHLDKMEEEGLLETEFRRPSGRSGPGAGRPTKFYKRAASEISVSLPERHYDLAGRLLAQAVSESQKSRIEVSDALRNSARNLGKTLAIQINTALGQKKTPKDVVEKISGVLVEQGYEPVIADGQIQLDNCPFHSLAQEFTSLICGMNYDLIGSIAEEMPGDIHARLEPKEGKCCVILELAQKR